MGLFDMNLKPKKRAEQQSAEHVANQEISETLKAFKDRSKGEKSEKATNTNSEFWFAVYFADEDQRNEFLRKINSLSLLDDQYINGEALARKMGIELTPKKIKKPKPFRKPKNIDDLIGF
ncbi:hypothetical protein [Dyadobacter crusticola]|uniref:hypothetical protein n=1 Tax=Dyadobacter crusticola TaxID=292407 RepID=UPI000AE59133|nr:hypothetical protein [Dyadobacter crusticola]